MLGITDGFDDCAVRSGQVGCCETVADAWRAEN